METHTSVIQALQDLPGLDMRIEGLHDVPQRVLQASLASQLLFAACALQEKQAFEPECQAVYEIEKCVSLILRIS